MAIKVLFFDTSALLKRFIDEPGSKNVKWLTSPATTVSHSLHLVINGKVYYEFEKKVLQFSKQGKLTEDKARNVLDQFSSHYKGFVFRVVGQNIISNTKREESIDDIVKNLNLQPGKSDWDGRIFQSIVNSLAYLGGQSHPILVTCDIPFSKKIMSKGYRVINPLKQDISEIENKILRGSWVLLGAI